MRIGGIGVLCWLSTLYSSRNVHTHYRYEELIDECKELRKHIRKVASDYDLDYDQSNSSSGHYKRAIEIVQKREAQEQQTRSVKSDEEEEEDRNKEKDKTTEGSKEEEVEEKKSKS